MLRRWQFQNKTVAVSATAPVLLQRAFAATEGNDNSSFSFKSGVNAQRLSTAATTSKEQTSTETKKPAPHRAAFLGILNKLSERADERSSTNGQVSDTTPEPAVTEGRWSAFKKQMGDYKPSFLFGRKETIEMERRKRLVFRDESAGALDRFNIITDPFLFIKYLRLGNAYASDAELERRLRYYKEHASKEVLTSDGGKIMRGPPHLFQLRPQVVATQVLSGASSTKGGVGISSTGIKGFIAASVAKERPKAVSAKSVATDANKKETDETIIPNVATSSPIVAGLGEDVHVQSKSDTYSATSNPNEVLKLPRIVVSQLSQFTSTAVNSNRVNGAYYRAYQPTDDITKEKRMSQADEIEGNATQSKKTFLGTGSTQHIFNSSNFRRPAMLVISQLGVKIGAEANNAWCCSALKYLEPQSPFITLFDSSCNSGNVYGKFIKGKKEIEQGGSDDTIGEKAISVDDAAFVDGTLTSASSSHSTRNLAKGSLKRPVDLYCLRSLDLQMYKFMHRLYVSRFASSIAVVGKKLDEVSESQRRASRSATSGAGTQEDPSTSTLLFGSAASIAAHNFVGPQLLTNFFEEPFRLRNYIGTTVLLVDHCGRVRWVSGGKPDEQERILIPKLLKELEAEYLSALSGGK